MFEKEKNDVLGRIDKSKKGSIDESIKIHIALLNDSTQFYYEAQAQNRRSEQILAPLPYDTLFDPGFAPGIAISAQNFFNPFGEDVIRVRRRMVETGGRRFTQDQNSLRAVIGVAGDIGSKWSWDVNYNYSRRVRADTDFGQFAGVRLICRFLHIP